MNLINFEEINQTALNTPGLLEKLLPGGRLNGHEYECGDISGGKGKSFRLNIETGAWSDFATGEKGGDVTSLVATQKGISQPEAARQLATLAGQHLPKVEFAGKAEKPAPITPVPANAPKPDFCHFRHGLPSETYPYYNKAGELLGYVCRFTKAEMDSSKGKPKKEFAPLVYTKEGWRWRDFPKPYPFYGLEKLVKMPPDAPILVVEGEHKADAVKGLPGANMAVLGMYGGSSRIASLDLQPLEGRRIYIWPDNDKPGFHAAVNLAKRLRGLAASLHIVEPPKDAPVAWDLGDAVEKDGWNFERIAGWLTAHRLEAEEFASARGLEAAGEDNQKAESPYSVVDVFDFMAMELPERENLIAPILQTQGIGLLHAQRGVGKTFVGLSIAHMVASGGSLFDRWKTPKPARVLYVDGEMPARAMQDRLKLICAGSQSDITARGMLKLLTPDLQNAPMPNLATAEGQRMVEPFIAESDFIILDNIATLFNFGRDNEVESWRPGQELLLKWRRLGKTSLLLAHQGKNGTQRGTSAREDVVDTVIALRRPENYLPEEGARFELQYLKCRHISGMEAQPFEARLENLDGNSLQWTTRPIEDGEMERYKDLKERGFKPKDIKREMGITKGKVQWLEQKRKKAI